MQLCFGGPENKRISLMNMLNRLKKALNRTRWVNSFTKNPIYSVLYLIAYKFDRSKTAKGTYQEIPFEFRSIDVEALKEVLIDCEYSTLSGFLKNKDKPIILDLGHHAGTFSLWAFSQNKKAKIFGVEANLETYRVAKKNVQTGITTGLDWTIVNRACWNNNDILAFSNDGNPLGYRIKETGQLHVKGITFPEILSQVGGKADLLKLDIEGAEEVFLSAHPECLNWVEAVVIEIHPDLCSQQKILELLESKFSSITAIHGRESGKPLLWCRNKL